MTITINAIDSQFAASTGSNVNSSPGQSKFDYPPTSTNGLIIESQLGDDSPYIFSPGDTYTLTFSGQGGGTIENATVVRSDYINYGGDEGYAVVFEGYDSNGELVQVVWTPEFDLETWYFNNFVGGQAPEFYNTDLDPGTTYQAVCFEASMPIDTPSGPMPAVRIRPGDRVLTHDHGPQVVRWVAARDVRGWGRHAPVVFEPGAIGNSGPVCLSQHHRVLVQGEEVMQKHGVSQVLLPAVSFVDGTHIRIRPQDRITYVHLLFERHELVSCQDVVCESLYLGRVAREVMVAASAAPKGAPESGAVETLMDVLGMSDAQTPARRFLSVREGHALLAQISGQSKQKPKLFLSPGRKQSRPYHLDLLKGPGWSGGGLPAFESVTQSETLQI